MKHLTVVDPNEAPEIVEDPHEAPEIVEDPHDAPEIVEDPNEAPEKVEDPNEAPEGVVDPNEACVTGVDPNEALDTVVDPEESINNYDGTEKRFVDLSAPYSRRLRDMSSFLKHKDKEYMLQDQLSASFAMIYTSGMSLFSFSGWFLIFSIPLMSLASAVLFLQCHKGGYKESDLKVTYILLWCTTLLEIFTIPTFLFHSIIWSITAAQDNMVSFVARRSMPTKLMRVSTLVCLKKYINEHWYIRQESSSACHDVIKSVVAHLRDGWKEFIVDAESYKRFNNFRGQWTTMSRVVRAPQLLSSLQLPFDQSVLVWHLATEFCLVRSNTTSSPTTNSAAQETASARRCSKVISDYDLPASDSPRDAYAWQQVRPFHHHLR
jgi:hypothetical protein